MRKERFLAILTFVVIFTTIALFLNTSKIMRFENNIIKDDVVSYYGYLPATFIYKDIKLGFVDNYKGNHKFTIWYNETKDGKRVFKVSCGMAIMYSPFFFLGHIVALITKQDAGGYSTPYRAAIILAVCFYLFWGLFFLYKALRKMFDFRAALISLLALVLGTNIFYYSSIESGMSHVYNFSLFCLFIWLTIKWHEKPNFSNSIFIGLVSGLISLIRPSNVIIALFFVFYNITTFKDLKVKFKFLLLKYLQILVLLLSAFVVWIPQFVYWKTFTGQWFYYSYGNESFFWGNPQIINTLFSYRKGLFVYTPIIIFSFIGFLFLRKNENTKGLVFPALLFTLLNIYIVSSWWCWWYGGGFGLRAYIDSYAILALPFAAFTSFVLNSKKNYKIFYSIVLFLLIGHQIFETFQYYYGSIHWDSMNKKAYWYSFLRLKPNEKLANMFTTPNYDNALKGIYDEKFYYYDAIPYSERIICTAENINAKDSILMSNNPNYTFSGFECLSKSVSFTGKYSIKLEKNTCVEGFRTKINNFKPQDIYVVKVKKYSWQNTLQQAMLVVESDNKQIFIQETFVRPIANSKWQEIGTYFVVPKDFEGTRIDIYCTNTSPYDAFFDDITIKKIKK